MKTYTCIIPVRHASTRFPGKPKALILGKEMLCHVYENAQKANRVHNVIVAAYDDPIVEFCKEKGYNYIHVDQKVKNGSEAVADVARTLDDEVVFEMQGDQPLVTPDIIDLFISQAETEMAENALIDIVHPFTEATDEHIENPDVVKAVKTVSDRLIFQTRLPVKSYTRTLGLYLWKNAALQKFLEIERSDLEKAEDTHPLRLYLNDFYVQGVPIDGKDWIEVDREHQIQQVEDFLRKKTEE